MGIVMTGIIILGGWLSLVLLGNKTGLIHFE